MTLSILQNNSAVVTMTSLDLLKAVNQARTKNGRSKIRHNDFSRSIKQKFGRHITSSHVLAANKTTQDVAALTPDQAEQVLSHYAAGSISFGAMEHAALCAIEQVLGVVLVRQFPCGPYRIDGYDISNNAAYEIDERHHITQRKDDVARQAFIEREIGCRFVRVEV